MNVKRLIVTGIVASVLFLVLDMVLGTAGGFIGAQVFGLPFEQPPGIEAKIKFGLLFEIVNGFMLAVIYAVIHPSLPGQGWKKGISYGLIVWGLRVVMWAFSTYMMTDMAPVLIVINVVTGLIEVLILGIVIAVIYKVRRHKYDGRSIPH
jgi:cellulose synthase/poly-beta-1,6-N-acetylglucosamine synthase-like glycosyltransferase